MLQKHPKTTVKKLIKRGALTLFVVEATLFAGSYALWYRLNTSQDFRLYMFKNHSWVLDGYYKIGETITSNNSLRRIDQTIWARDGKI